MTFHDKGEYFGRYCLLIKGYFKNDKRHGEGMFTYTNKDIYSGLWANGKKHGLGTYVYTSTNSRVINTLIYQKVIHNILT